MPVTGPTTPDTLPKSGPHETPGASLGELAAAGIGRTTLDQAIGGRREVVVAVANHAVDRCAAALRVAVEQARMRPASTVRGYATLLARAG